LDIVAGAARRIADPDTEVVTEAVRDGRCAPLDNETVRCQRDDDAEELWFKKL
jgi:hypothetical protein